MGTIISPQWETGKNGNIVFSDSAYDRLVEIATDGAIVSIYQDRNVLLHPSTHIIMESKVPMEETL